MIEFKKLDADIIGVHSDQITRTIGNIFSHDEIQPAHCTLDDMVCWYADDLRAIADKLDELNAEADNG